MAAHEYYHPNSPAPRPAGPYSGSQQYPQSPVPANSMPSQSPNGPPPPYSAMAPSQPQHSIDSKQTLPPPPPLPPQQQQPAARQASGYQPQYPQAVPTQTYYQYRYPDPPTQAQYYSQQYYYPQQPQYNQYAQPVYASGALRPSGNSRPQSHSQPPPMASHHERDSRSDSRHRHDRHHRHHSSDRRHGSESSGKKKGRLDTFVGAGGGALIGDCIFPGLGTVGGALLGGLGGHKVAEEKRRRSNDESRYRREVSSRSRGYYDYDEDDERVGRRRY